MDAAVCLSVALHLDKVALEWIDFIADVYGQKSVLHLVDRKELDSLKNHKKFINIMGPNAVKSRLKKELKEEIRTFKQRDYDNIKDVLFSARSLVLDAQELVSISDEKSTDLLASTQEHLENVLITAREMASGDAVIKKYLKGLI